MVFSAMGFLMNFWYQIGGSRHRQKTGRFPGDSGDVQHDPSMTYGIHTFLFAGAVFASLKPAAIAASWSQPVRMVLGPGGL
jgi:hypothetical protein